MKILAIRGENLASLDGPFEVDLSSGPLARAGVFAITGRTGAGKTTLLDAVCLALFDRTPRLAERGGALVGRPDDADRIAANDVRGVLRRGRGEGHAEVDFLGRDHRRYRARWSVRRARQSPKGRLQNQEMTLLDLEADQLIGHKKTEVLEAIEDRLGLSFEQFRRSVLLAQGEFAAFLKAGADERALLLERITGLEIYTTISQRAHARARDEGLALKELEALANAEAPLDAEGRAALEARREAAHGQTQAAEGALKTAQAALDWHGRTREFEGLVAEADAGAEGAVRACADAEPERRALAEVEAAAPLRPAREAARDAGKLLERAQRELDDARSAETRAQDEAARLEAARAGAEAGREAAVRDRAAAAPALREARALDTRVTAAAGALNEAQERAEAAARDARGAEAALAALETRLARLQSEAAGHEAWLTGQQAVAPLAAEWTRWQDALRRGVEAAEAVGRLERARPGQAGAHDRAAQAVAALRLRVEQAAAAVDEARQAARAAREAAEARPLAGLTARRAAHDQRGRHLNRLELTLDRAAGARERLAAQEAAREEAGRHAEEAAAAAGRAAAGLETLRARLDEAARARDLARDVAGLAGHRAALREGAPCPLCGALEHPYAARGAEVDAALAGAQQRVTDLEAEVRALEAGHSRHAADAEAERRRADRAAAEAARLRPEAEAAEAAWREAVEGAALALPADPADAEAATRLAGLRAEWDGEGQALTGETEARQALVDAREATAHRLEVAGQQHTAAGRDLAGAEEALRAAERALAEADAETTRRRRDLDGIVEALAPVQAALGGAPLLRTRPEEALVRGEEAVGAWREHDAAREALQRELAGLEPERAAAGAHLERARQAARERAATRDEARGALDALRDARAELLDGAPADAVEQRLDGAVRAAEAAARDAADAAAKGGQALAGARRGRELAAQALAAAGEAHARAGAELSAALAEAGLDLPTLDARLAREPAWIEAMRGRLQALDRAREKATAVADERRARLQGHLATARPALDAPAARAEVEARTAELETARTARAGCDAELRADDIRREKHARHAEALAAQRRRTDLWARLAEVIGSHDGKKLRVFAQSLTLEILLDYANYHLDELSGRYRLMRVPTSDFDLQVVDRHMADEVRSLNSLSGGESFLVSLALALGLSSLAATETRVDSLFVDEGFGTLDAHTLEAVLATLDALQAGGRQVGVISHVTGIAERLASRVDVVSLGAGRSRVEVRGAA